MNPATPFTPPGCQAAIGARCGQGRKHSTSAARAILTGSAPGAPTIWMPTGRPPTTPDDPAMRHLHDKLGARRRLEAIDRARALGLLLAALTAGAAVAGHLHDQPAKPAGENRDDRHIPGNRPRPGWRAEVAAGLDVHVVSSDGHDAGSHPQPVLLVVSRRAGLITSIDRNAAECRPIGWLIPVGVGRARIRLGASRGDGRVAGGSVQHRHIADVSVRHVEGVGGLVHGDPLR